MSFPWFYFFKNPRKRGADGISITFLFFVLNLPLRLLLLQW